jgi:protein-L-isoaspartate(D-aspartate) O-methyltransferase
MVRTQIEARGVADRRVLEAMRAVPRELFVPAAERSMAYDDSALPIEAGQTISQPYIVAMMTEALELRPTDRVLEIGAGSGYAAAVMAQLAAHVDAVERHKQLVETARERLAETGTENVTVHLANGSIGLPAEAPFDAISVAAGGPEVPEQLLEQLAPGGRLVMPVGSSRAVQKLVRVRRTADGVGVERETLGEVRFVPLIGEQGWDNAAE